MCGLCGRTGAPTKRGPPHEDKRNFFLLLLICCNMPTCRKIIELLNKKRISCCAATPPIVSTVQRCCGACGECWLTYGESRHWLLPTSTQQLASRHPWRHRSCQFRLHDTSWTVSSWTAGSWPATSWKCRILTVNSGYLLCFC